MSDIGHTVARDDGLVDPEQIAEAITALLARTPHLGRRRPTATVEQGARPEPTTTSLADMLRARA